MYMQLACVFILKQLHLIVALLLPKNLLYVLNLYKKK